jgi:hypothetical protein
MAEKLPKAAQRTADTFPDVWAAYQALGSATENALARWMPGHAA